jgi:hypothetical protein
MWVLQRKKRNKVARLFLEALEAAFLKQAKIAS